MAEKTGENARDDGEGNTNFANETAIIGGSDQRGVESLEIINPADAIGDRDTSGFDINRDGFNVTSALGTGGTGTGKRRPGRPKGSGKTKTTLDLNGVEAILLSIHSMAATMLKTPELVLDKEEAKNLSKAANDVAEHYSVAINPKTLAWLNFGMAVSMIYGTRIIAINARQKREKQNRAGDNETLTENGSLVDFPGNGKIPEFK